MARIQLVTQQAFGVRYQHPNDHPGTTTLIPTYHITVPLYVPPSGMASDQRPRHALEPTRTFDAILDTGTPLTLIPYNVWQGFADDVQILAQPEADAVFQVAGGSHNGQLGRIRVGALDEAGNWMPAEWTVAIFLDPPTPTASLLIPLLGLNAHLLLHNRRLRHADTSVDENLNDVPEWCLEDKSRLMPW